MSWDFNSLKPLEMQNGVSYIYDAENIYLIHPFGCILNNVCSFSF